MRRSQDRGRSRAAWLESRHSFSFASYLDRRPMDFRARCVWLLPDRAGQSPSYHEAFYEPAGAPLQTRVTPDGRDGTLRIHRLLLKTGTRVEHVLAPGRHAWLQLIRGELALNGTRLKAGDGAGLSEVSNLERPADDKTEALLFDLA